MSINQNTNVNNIVDKLNHIEGLLDIIEYDLEQNLDKMKLNSNVIHILSNIKHEYNSIEKNNEVTLFELIDNCELWTYDLAEAVVYNQGKFRNKQLLNHMCEIVNMCRLVMKLSHNSLYHLQ